MIKNMNSAVAVDNAATLNPLEGFTRLAYTYDQRLAGNPVLLLEAPAIVMALPQLTGKRVADLGCGTGRYAIQLARMGAEEIYGIDLVPEMLEIAKRKAEKGELDLVNWQQADLTQSLPFAGASLDILLCSFVLSYLEDITTFFQEAARVLSPGGLIIIGDHHPYYQFQQSGKPEGLFYRFMNEEGEEYRIPQIPHMLSDFFNIGRAEGLKLTYFAEPIVERDLVVNYPHLRNVMGTPLAMVLRFEKEV